MQQQAIFLIALLLTGFGLTAQDKIDGKRVKRLTVSNVIDAPAAEVWAVVGEDYGAIAFSHPKIVASEYINGSLRAGEGAERVCNFNEKGTQFLREVQRSYDPANYTFVNQVTSAGKFPVDPQRTFAVYKVEAIDANTSRFTMNMTFRTTPAFLGGMMRGAFENLINDYAIAIEHHLKTGERVTKENFKSVKKQYAR